MHFGLYPAPLGFINATNVLVLHAIWRGRGADGGFMIVQNEDLALDLDLSQGIRLTRIYDRVNNIDYNIDYLPQNRRHSYCSNTRSIIPKMRLRVMAGPSWRKHRCRRMDTG